MTLRLNAMILPFEKSLVTFSRDVIVPRLATSSSQSTESLLAPQPAGETKLFVETQDELNRTDPGFIHGSRWRHLNLFQLF